MTADLDLRQEKRELIQAQSFVPQLAVKCPACHTYFALAVIGGPARDRLRTQARMLSMGVSFLVADLAAEARQLLVKGLQCKSTR